MDSRRQPCEDPRAFDARVEFESVMLVRTSVAAALAFGSAGMVAVHASTPVTIYGYGQFDLTTSLGRGASSSFEVVFKGDINPIAGEF